DKRYYLNLTNPDKKVRKEDLNIHLERHADSRTLVIEDTGIGLTSDEMEKNLGTIAKSGSAEFKAQLEKASKNIDIIGQFGVGFYSAFMVAKKITVESLSANDTQGYTWTSTGEDGYSIEKNDRTSIGSRITLYLKDDTDDDKYSDYLQEYKIRDLVKKYSDYVRYPIIMEVEKSEPDPDNKDKSITKKENETLNSMIPLWKKQRSKIKPEEYNEFYKAKFNDWQDPQKVIHFTVEGNLSYTALLFIPSKAPYNFYNTDFEPGIQLYSKGVFIMDKAKELLPDSYRFITGLVDSDDLNLNISREILQQDRQVKALAESLKKKIHSYLEDMLKNERDNYEKFFDNFGLNLKYSIYKSYGMEKEDLQDLLLYKSGRDNKYTTLKEYVDRMDQNQKDIYYACGTTMEDINRLPSLEKLKEKGYEVLYFTDTIDEFVISMMQNYAEKPFKSINKGDLDLDTEEEKKVREEKSAENKDMLSAMKDALGDKVKEVRISSRLKDDPVVLVADEGVSLDMEKVLAQDPMNRNLKATKILELNPDHPVFAAVKNVYDKNPDALKDYANVLYDQACLIEGLPIADPVDYARKISKLMVAAEPTIEAVENPHPVKSETTDEPIIAETVETSAEDKPDVSDYAAPESKSEDQK
ncbi:MAG: molecular chaperone HtpG, partial [Erysipelotrichia bacterium]|nr:molecular chaperone HtpG [Erysipelotrichia bacterium]